MQRFDQPDGVRVTHEEARQVFDLWTSRQQQRDQMEAQPTIRDIAEGLHISEAQVQDLLIEIRARQIDKQRREAQRPKMVAMAICVAAVLLVSALLFASRATSPGLTLIEGQPTRDASIAVEGTGVATTAPAARTPSPTSTIEVARDAAAPAK